MLEYSGTSSSLYGNFQPTEKKIEDTYAANDISV